MGGIRSWLRKILWSLLSSQPQVDTKIIRLSDRILWETFILDKIVITLVCRTYRPTMSTVTSGYYNSIEAITHSCRILMHSNHHSPLYIWIWMLVLRCSNSVNLELGIYTVSEVPKRLRLSSELMDWVLKHCSKKIGYIE